MHKYQITMTGLTPLLLHRDNYSWGGTIDKWRRDPDNKGGPKADDRNPAWTWIGYCYFANNLVVIDADNLMAMLRDAGKKCPATTGKGSLKAATQSGIIVNEIGWPIVTTKGTVSKLEIDTLVHENDFEKHEQFAIDHGFELFVKRSAIGTQKHIRVRPRFDNWVVSGTITLLDDALQGRLESIFNQAGRFVGICDWRPGSKASGQFGMFETEIKEL